MLFELLWLPQSILVGTDWETVSQERSRQELQMDRRSLVRKNLKGEQQGREVWTNWQLLLRENPTLPVTDLGDT